MNDKPTFMEIGPRLTFEAHVMRACPQCGAPSAYSNDPSIQKGWPGCYAPEKHGKPVGDVCPNCNNMRPQAFCAVKQVEYQWSWPRRLLARLWWSLVPRKPPSTTF